MVLLKQAKQTYPRSIILWDRYYKVLNMTCEQLEQSYAALST